MEQIRRRFDPSSLFGYKGLNCVQWKGPGDNPTYGSSITSSESEIILATLRGTFEARSGVYLTKDQLYLGYSQSLTGEAMVIPPSILEYKERVNNPNFKNSKKSKEIVVAPFAAGSIRIEYQPGYKVISQKRYQINGALRDIFNFPVKIDGKLRNLIHLGGSRYFDVGSYGFSAYYYEERISWVDPRPSLSHLTNVNFYKQLLERPIDKGLATLALAEANRGQMDILTTLAEIPETLKGVLDGFKTVATACKKHKAGELSITRAYEKRKKYLNRKLQEDLSKIDESRRGADKYKQKLLNRHALRVKKTHRQALNGALEEFNSALASIWMSFRYSISPNIYAIEDAMNLIANLYNEYITVRENEKVYNDFPVPEDWSKIELLFVDRCFIKTRFDIAGDIPTRLLRHGSANVIATLFELGKRSFVLDWFLNIGDLISACFGLNVGLERKSSSSSKVVFSHRSTDPISHASFRITGECYDRNIIEINNHIGLSWNPMINFFRSLDALAMLWPSIQNLLRKSK